MNDEMDFIDEDSTASDGVEAALSQVSKAVDLVGKLEVNQTTYALNELLLNVGDILQFTLEKLDEVVFELDFDLDESRMH
jgi:hypothetical protein